MNAKIYLNFQFHLIFFKYCDIIPLKIRRVRTRRVKCRLYGELTAGRKVYLAVPVLHPASLKRVIEPTFFMRAYGVMRGKGGIFMKQRNQLLKISIAGVLAAMSVVIGIICKDLFTFGIYYRVTFENLPVLIAGIILGPVYGTAVGVVEDVISCLLSTNPVINPIITVGAAAVGLVSGLVPRFIVKKRSVFQYAMAVYPAHLIGQVLIKSVGKIIYYGMPWYGIFIGLGISAATATVEIIIISSIMKLSPVKSLDARL